MVRGDIGRTLLPLIGLVALGSPGCASTCAPADCYESSEISITSLDGWAIGETYQISIRYNPSDTLTCVFAYVPASVPECSFSLSIDDGLLISMGHRLDTVSVTLSKADVIVMEVDEAEFDVSTTQNRSLCGEPVCGRSKVAVEFEHGS